MWHEAPAAVPVAASAGTRTRWIPTGPATRRDLARMPVGPVVGIVLALLPLTLTAFGVLGLLMPVPWDDISGDGGDSRCRFVKVTDRQRAL
ncbi:hypothetical protein ACIRPQ_14485 [Streptomyces sp. NPDC101213]|uniref:hypothetical protein n=1 Tax=Streptomyces sp. NPDC101213 TaxID=3366130 RepID=UPI00381C400A